MTDRGEKVEGSVDAKQKRKCIKIPICVPTAVYS